ncbi:NUDIX hydrolase [Trinickia dinghuensis]|uniref:NUDIX domain-containing protein n=1 Tax=Trinickia dinghuensis TaxID=2291023 RepID=A0A3D8JZ31_9BURK|nr:NUDIX domain-containing protein [Trinickia dinghuensis]RDU98423.1 NUDIX domain-containing protein [Trinickia dinghuensis]
MIEKCAAIILCQRRLLVVRKRGASVFISPGGKISEGEAPIDCLRRELREELCVELVDAEPFGTHERAAADEDSMIRVHTWNVTVSGTCTPNSEIEELRWIRGGDTHAVGSVFAECVMPELIRLGRLDA